MSGCISVGKGDERARLIGRRICAGGPKAPVQAPLLPVPTLPLAGTLRMTGDKYERGFQKNAARMSVFRVMAGYRPASPMLEGRRTYIVGIMPRTGNHCTRTGGSCNRTCSRWHSWYMRAPLALCSTAGRSCADAQGSMRSASCRGSWRAWASRRRARPPSDGDGW